MDSLNEKELLTILLCVLCVAVAGLLAYLFCKKRERADTKKTGKPRVIIKNGVDLRSQRLESDKGKYFSENDPYGTLPVVTGKAAVWQISFLNLRTGETARVCFERQLYVGRLPEPSGKSGFRVEGDLRISRRHCVIYDENGTLYLQDLRSGNGTFLNQKRIESPAALFSGDHISLGDTRFEIRTQKIQG